LEAKPKALEIAEALVSKRGCAVEVFDLREIGAFTDFFVIASGTSRRHVKTLAEEAVRCARLAGDTPLGIEGDPPGRWILVDLGDVIVHLFEQEARDYYALERLWDEAQRVDLPPPAEAPVHAGVRP
jgi:ribosome-associated protein